jgi:hypothetical protein
MSQDLNPLPEDLAGIERALGALKPAPAALNRDQLMYEAGRAAAQRSAHTHLRLWQGACALLLVGSTALALFPREKVVDKQIAIQPKPQPAYIPPAPPPAPPLAPPLVASTPAPALPPLLWPSIPLVRRSLDSMDWPVAQTTNHTGNAGTAHYPTLRRSEGLDTLPDWQRKLVIFGENRL